MEALLNNDVFSCFVFYAVLLVLKMYTIAIIVGQFRLRKKVSAKVKKKKKQNRGRSWELCDAT